MTLPPTFSFFSIGCLASLGFAACFTGSAAAQPNFEKDVHPILKARCFECHSGKTPKAGLDLQTRAGLVKGGRSGPAIVPGTLKSSLMWVNISTDKMPFNEKKLTEAEKEIIREWILAGAPGEGVAAVKSATPKQARKSSTGSRGVAALVKLIDADIDEGLKKEKASLSPQTDDAEFLRRVYLDFTGRIPTIDQARAFLDSKSPKKRAELIDELLESPNFSNQLATEWSRLITAEEPGLRDGLEKWLAKEFQSKRPWNEIVREMLLAVGKGPETAFIMSNVENKMPQPEKLTGSAARLFLGVQLQCAECHNHPFTSLKQTDFWGLAAFFAKTKVATKATPMGVAEISVPTPKGKEKIAGAAIVIPTSAGRAAGKIVGAKFLMGDSPALDADSAFRPALADWMTAAKNPYLAPAFVNRVWAHLFGVGLVNPIDDLNEDNPPSHPEILDALADEFRASNFDVRRLFRIIASTNAYQRGSRKPTTGEDREIPYARMRLKVMSAESLYDSLVLATGMPAIKIQLSGPAAGGGRATAPVKDPREKFVRFFSTRDNDSYSTDFTHGIPQALSLMNDPVFNQGSPLLEKFRKESETTLLENLYLATLARRPSPEEIALVRDFLAKQPDPARGYIHVQWSLLNSPEFILIR